MLKYKLIHHIISSLLSVACWTSFSLEKCLEFSLHRLSKLLVMLLLVCVVTLTCICIALNLAP